jgi:hypothetical protein
MPLLVSSAGTSKERHLLNFPPDEGMSAIRSEAVIPDAAIDLGMVEFPA